MGEKDHSDHQLTGDAGLRFAPFEEIHRVRGSIADPLARAAITGDICRLNTLYMIMNAGSGHIGSSFSSTDIITWLWTEELRDPNGPAQGSDVYFSSKGHDAPALYALLIALGKLDASLLHRLRRFGGLPGHPDVETPYIAANTGSLGMGISKAYGMARAHRYLGTGGRIVVMTGDGELQEGQIWESLQPAANERLAEITVVVDHNKFQSDSAVAAVSDLGPIEEKFRAFGWHVRRADGHDPAVLRDVFAEFRTVTDKPKVFIADTIKGKGVSFMHGVACGDQTYAFHAGAPSLENMTTGARTKIKDNINERDAQVGPAGKYLLYLQDDAYWTVNLATSAVTNISKGVPTSFIDKESDATIKQKPNFGVAGWTKDDAAVLLYDKYDVWKVPADGSKAQKLTDGAAEQVRHRLTRVGQTEEWMSLDKPVYVSLFGLLSKKSGYGLLKPACWIRRLLLLNAVLSRFRPAAV
jgi:transketolase N-terminal domain/subunit